MRAGASWIFIGSWLALSTYRKIAEEGVCQTHEGSQFAGRKSCGSKRWAGCHGESLLPLDRTGEVGGSTISAVVPCIAKETCSLLFSHSVLSGSFATPRTVACQAPLIMGFSRQESWSGLPCPSLGHVSDPGIESTSPALQTDSLPLSQQGGP